jgi:hypothetical protein
MYIRIHCEIKSFLYGIKGVAFQRLPSWPLPAPCALTQGWRERECQPALDTCHRLPGAAQAQLFPRRLRSEITAHGRNGSGVLLGSGEISTRRIIRSADSRIFWICLDLLQGDRFPWPEVWRGASTSGHGTRVFVKLRQASRGKRINAASTRTVQPSVSVLCQRRPRSTSRDRTHRWVSGG